MAQTGGPNSQQRTKGPCFNCSKIGHFAHECHAKQNAPRARQVNVMDEEDEPLDYPTLPISKIDRTITAFDTLSDEEAQEAINRTAVGASQSFSKSLIRSALIKRREIANVYISNRKSMTLRTYVHSRSKRAEVVALVDCGATENFMNLQYAKYLHLPIKRFTKERRLFNVDRTENKAGNIQFYVDLDVQTGTNRTNMRFLLSDLGENKLIMGYPWFAATAPKIDWKRGWLDPSQLPIILRSVDATKIKFTPRTRNVPRTCQEKDHVYITCLTIGHDDPSDTTSIPPHFQRFTKVFSEEASHQYPPAQLWDQAIELQDSAPALLPGRLIKLSQPEQEELCKFLKEHLDRGTIRPSKSRYMASFFFIKKKDGKLRPIQDYRPVNKYTIRNHYPLPLIPQLIDRLCGCSLFTKFDIRWGYNNVRIKDGDQWKAAFLTIFWEEIAQGWLTVYMDDMAIHTGIKGTETEQQHLACHRELVGKILAKLEEHRLFLKPEKCAFKQTSIEFLGVTVSRDTVQMDDKKVDKVKTWPAPMTQTEVQKFLGFTGHYRYFIQDYSHIAKPLLDLTHKTTPWHWDDTQQQAFEILRDKMVSKPVL
jgi:hypothetical protein